jgi:outer membrane lipoprotein-sorting protein
MSLTLIAAAALSFQGPKIEDVLQKTLKSVTMTAVVGSAKQVELQKINKDFAQSYRFKSMEVWMKEPFKLRLESKVDDTDMLMIFNGPVRKLSIPKARLSQKINLADEPGKRQTAFDFGLIPSSLFDGFFVGKYVRTERNTGELVFDVTYVPTLKDKSRHRVWIDADKKALTKRQWFANWGGHLMATFEYSKHVQQGGVWIPTTITVINAEGKQAGTTNYTNVKVNPTIDDAQFNVG